MKKIAWMIAALLITLASMSCGGSKESDNTDHADERFAITYEGNGNTGGVAPTDANEYTEGSSVTILGAGNLIRTDHTFTGWNTESDGSGTNYAIGATLVMGSSNVVLYAKWTQNPTYTVSYDGNGNTGGTNPTDPNNYEENDNVTVLGLGTLVKAGYEFNSWNTESDGSGTNYAIGATLVMGNSNVVLYAKWTQLDEDFTIAILPDTQSYVAWKESILLSQIDWLINNIASSNIKFIGHVGDLVQNYDTVPAQWSLIQTQMDRLIDAGVPFSTLPGNHDYQQNTRNSTMYNSYFPLSYFSSFPTYGGSFDSNSDNTYHIVDTGNEELLIMSLEFGPRDAVVSWANSVLGIFSNIKTIILTHAYLRPDGELLASGDGHAASNGYGLGADVNDGTDLWTNLIYPNSNVFLVICGHDGLIDDGAGLRISTHADTSPVYQVMTNYQYFPWSDSGYMLLLDFSPKDSTINMSTYSPYLDVYKTTYDTQAEFSME